MLYMCQYCSVQYLSPDNAVRCERKCKDNLSWQDVMWLQYDEVSMNTTFHPFYVCGCCGTQYLDPGRAAECEMACSLVKAKEEYILNEIPNQVGSWTCECGADSTGSSGHSVWCPKYAK